MPTMKENIDEVIDFLVDFTMFCGVCSLTERMDGLPIKTAARVHGVPKTSMHNRIKGKIVHGVKILIPINLHTITSVFIQ